MIVSAAQKVLFAGHGWHLVELLGVFLTSITGIWAAEAMRRRPRGAASLLPRGTLPALVAGFGATAGAIHLVVMPEHFRESALYGTFFLVAAVLQIAYSAWLLARPSRVLLAVGAVGNIGVVLLWLFTRIVEIPLGPAAGTTEQFGRLDVMCSICEALVAGGAFALLWSRRSSSVTGTRALPAQLRRVGAGPTAVSPRPTQTH